LEGTLGEVLYILSSCGSFGGTELQRKSKGKKARLLMRRLAWG